VEEGGDWRLSLAVGRFGCAWGHRLATYWNTWKVLGGGRDQGKHRGIGRWPRGTLVRRNRQDKAAQPLESGERFCSVLLIVLAESRGKRGRRWWGSGACLSGGLLGSGRRGKRGGIMVTLPAGEAGRLQEGDDRWAPPIIGEKE
jgi:hypothetical protein